jgi:hypothetical protein
MRRIFRHLLLRREYSVIRERYESIPIAREGEYFQAEKLWNQKDDYSLIDLICGEEERNIPLLELCGDG